MRPFSFGVFKYCLGLTVFKKKTCTVVMEQAKMKPNAYLINTARGGIVNEDALYVDPISYRVRKNMYSHGGLFSLPGGFIPLYLMPQDPFVFDAAGCGCPLLMIPNFFRSQAGSSRG